MVNSEHVKGWSELDAFLKKLPANVQTNVCRGAVRVGARKGMMPVVQQKVPTHYGDLLKTAKIHAKKLDNRVTADITIGDKENYQGYWLEYGVLPHDIIPKHTIFGLGRASALHLDGGEGENLFFTHVKHPGIKARHFMTEAMLEGKAAFVAEATKYVKKRLTKEGIMNSDPEAT